MNSGLYKKPAEQVSICSAGFFGRLNNTVAKQYNNNEHYNE